MPSASGLARRVYDHLPAPARRLVSAVPFGWRVGGVYRRTLNDILAAEHASAEELRVLQTNALRGLLEGALRNVPYYRRRYGKLAGQAPWKVLAEIEPLEKKDIQANPADFLDETQARRGTYETSTGGTTGQPLNIVLDKGGFQIEWAFMIAQWRRAGFRPGVRRATFRGVSFASGALWQENPVYDELQFSPFAMSDANLERYVRVLRDYQPEFLYGYPSALTLLARYVEAHPEANFPKVRGLLCGSENVQEGQRELLERVFGARFYSWYGMSEKVVLAGECEHASTYHAFPTYGVTELRTDDGRLTSETGAVGEIVGTGFMNKSMPFIRYRTGDHSEIVGQRCNACGRNHLQLGRVRGRWVQEMVIGRSGAKISLTALNMHGEVFKGIERFQFRQQEKGRVTLRLVAAGPLSAEARARIGAALAGKTASEVEWTIEQVTAIDLSPRGKGVFLVQELPAEESR